MNLALMCKKVAQKETDLDQPPWLCDNSCLDPVYGKAINLFFQADRYLANLKEDGSQMTKNKKWTKDLFVVLLELHNSLKRIFELNYSF